MGVHEGVWWQSTPMIGQIQGALKPFAYIWNFWISKPLFSIQISSACLTDGQFQCDPALFACDLYCRDSCILFRCSHWLLQRFTFFFPIFDLFSMLFVLEFMKYSYLDCSFSISLCTIIGSRPVMLSNLNSRYWARLSVTSDFSDS